MLHKGMICIALLLVVCCLTGCNSQRNTTELPEEDGAEEITISLCYADPDYINMVAKEFEKQTGVKVNVKNYLDLSKTTYDSSGKIIEVSNDLGLSKYRETALAELLSGTGADIYDVAGLDFQNLGERNLLCNIKNWVEPEPELSDENVFQSILCLVEENNALYAVPFGYMAYVMETSTDTPDLGDQPMTWEEFFEKAKDFPRNGFVTSDNAWVIFWKRFYVREGTFIDEKTKTQSLNSSEMIALLEQCKQWQDEGLCPGLADGNKNLKDSVLFFGTSFNYYNAVLLGELPPDYPDPKKIYLFPSDAKKNEASVNSLLAINASSEKRRTAWEFMKFMLSEEMQKRLNVEFPLNRNAFNDRIESWLESFQADLVGQGLSKIENLNIEQIKTNALEFVESIDSVGYHTPIRMIVRDISEEYFYGKISAEEAAKKMADKVGLYLKEQS